MSRINRRYVEVRQTAMGYLGGVCVVCGTSDNLEFDHVDPATKLFAIGTGWNEPAEIFWLEVAKCQLLCETHHEEKSISEGSMIVLGEAHGMSSLGILIFSTYEDSQNWDILSVPSHESLM